MPQPAPSSPALCADLPDSLLLFEHLADAVYLLDPETSNIVWGNRKAWESLGLGRDDVLNHSVLSLQMDVHGLPQWSEIAAAIRSTDCFRFNGRHRHAAGHEVAVEVCTTHFDVNDRGYFLSVARDITNRVAQDNTSPGLEKQLWFALNEAGDGLWDWQVDSGALYFSPQLKRMLGYGPDEMAPVLDTWVQSVHAEDTPRVMAALQDHMGGRRSRYEAEYRMRNRNGHYLWVHDRGRVCEQGPDGKPSRVVGMVQDITDRKMLELRLQELAGSDMLTGLANRREGANLLDRHIALCRRMDLSLGVAFIDIDHFKAVNDVHGHATGDLVLSHVGQAINRAVRGSDIVCRWGGEEFIVIAPDTSAEEMGVMGEKIRCAVVALHDALYPPVTISVGVAAARGEAVDAQCLMAQADSALYRAKENGRNRVELA